MSSSLPSLPIDKYNCKIKGYITRLT